MSDSPAGEETGIAWHAQNRRVGSCMLIPARLKQATYNHPARVHRPRYEYRAASIGGPRVFLVPLEQVFVTYRTRLLNSKGVFLKDLVLKVCALCEGSGMVHKMSEYPDLPDQR